MEIDLTIRNLSIHDGLFFLNGVVVHECILRLAQLFNGGDIIDFVHDTECYIEPLFVNYQIESDVDNATNIDHAICVPTGEYYFCGYDVSNEINKLIDMDMSIYEQIIYLINNKKN